MAVPIKPLAVSAYTVTSALGHGLDAHLEALTAARTGLRANDFSRDALTCWIGRVADVESTPIPDDWRHRDCRNNRLAWLGLQQDGFLEQVNAARDRYGASRVALILGTSTASIGATEEAYRRLEDQRIPPDMREPDIHSPHSLILFVADALGLEGAALTMSTACSSSAKVFASAERLIRLGVVDAAVVGGVDTLCDSVLYGFNALELVSPEPCRPFDRTRNGISIGEAAGFALLERAAARPGAAQLIGYGESSDAYHMSTPHPEAAGARLALQDALDRAGITPEQVDYVNLHGTASQKNDDVEAGLIAQVFPDHTRVSSTKGFTGHTLGAAGIVEAAITLLAMQQGFVPGNLGASEPDPVCGPQFAWRNETRAVNVALSNSFGFGGNNACLAFRRGGV